MDWLYEWGDIVVQEYVLNLHEFVRDESRAGEYAVNPKAYASASFDCLKYLSRSCLGVPIHLQHTRHNLEMRRNSPWLWRQHSIKPILSQLVLNDHDMHNRVDITLSKEFRHHHKRAEQQGIYMDATYLALVFICRALPRSAKSDELVAFINAEKPFSQRALQFSAKLKKCKAAITTYLARVQSSAPDV